VVGFEPNRGIDKRVKLSSHRHGNRTLPDHRLHPGAELTSIGPGLGHHVMPARHALRSIALGLPAPLGWDLGRPNAPMRPATGGSSSHLSLHAVAVLVGRTRDRRTTWEPWRAFAARGPHRRDRIAGSLSGSPLRRWE